MPTIYEGKYGLGGALKEAGDFAAAVSKAQKEAAAMAMQNAQMAADIALARQRVDEMRLRRLHQQQQDVLRVQERSEDNARADEQLSVSKGHLQLAQDRQAREIKAEQTEAQAFLGETMRLLKPTPENELALETVHELAKSGNLVAARKARDAALEDQQVGELAQELTVVGEQFQNLAKGVAGNAVFDDADKAKAQENLQTYQQLQSLLASNPSTPVPALRESVEVVKKQLASAADEFRAKYQAEVNRQQAITGLDAAAQEFQASPEAQAFVAGLKREVDLRLMKPEDASERLSQFRKEVAAAAMRASGQDQQTPTDVRGDVLLRGAQAPDWLRAEAELDVQRAASDQLMDQVQDGDQESIARLNELRVNAYKRKGLPTLPAPPELMQARAAKSAEAIEATLAAMEQQMGRVLQDWEVEILLGGGEIVP